MPFLILFWHDDDQEPTRRQTWYESEYYLIFIINQLTFVDPNVCKGD